jgi:hypothetical protein
MRSASPCRMSVGNVLCGRSWRKSSIQASTQASVPIAEAPTAVTAGAALSHLDLTLALIRRANPGLANLTARYLVVDERTSQSIYAIPDHLANADPLIRQFERWARGAPGRRILTQ